MKVETYQALPATVELPIGSPAGLKRIRRSRQRLSSPDQISRVVDTYQALPATVELTR